MFLILIHQLAKMLSNHPIGYLKGSSFSINLLVLLACYSLLVLVIKKLPKGFTEWETLNKYVKSFGRIFGECLVESDQRKVLEEARTILTPYGGRFEYNIDGVKFQVHLKHADRVQKGKRWSMVMYLYYLIGRVAKLKS